MLVTTKKITGDGNPHTIASLLNGVSKCKWLQVQISSTGGPLLIGGPEVSSITPGTPSGNASVGFPVVAPYGGNILPPVSELSNLYDLTLIWAYANATDVYTLMAGCD